MSAMAIHEPIMPSKPPPPVETETVRAPSPTHYSGAESDGEKSVNESESSQPSPVPTPLGSSLAGKRARQADVGTPSRNVAPKTEAAALAGDGNPERKIWMRPCNECGFDLHVRRTKCTECGAVQMSKRAAEHAKVTAERAVIEALDEEQLRKEAETAASQLTKIFAAAPALPPPPPPPPADTRLAADMSMPPPSKAVVPAASQPKQSSSLPPAKVAAQKAAYAALSEEGKLKLQRLLKLRALLNSVPKSCHEELRELGRKKRAAAAATTTKASAARSPATAAAADAIAMLASVAATAM